MKHISQAAARRLQRRVKELEVTISDMRNRYAQKYPGGTHVETLGLTDDEINVLRTCVKLNHTLIAKFNGDTYQLMIYAVRNP